MGYKRRNNLVKDERGDLHADPHKIFNRWKNYFCQFQNAQGVVCVRQNKIHTVEPLVSGPNGSKIETGVGKLKRYKPPNVYQIPAEMIQAKRKTLSMGIHKSTIFI
jgi:hypothetical protein